MSFKATVESMSKIMDEMGIVELELERQFLFGIYRKHILLSKKNNISYSQPIHTKEIEKKEENKKETNNINQKTIRSSMVGVVYLSPEPNAKPFITKGSKVKTGDTIALIEAMKTFNPIKSEIEGTIKEILVQDGQTVEYDQPIVIIE